MEGPRTAAGRKAGRCIGGRWGAREICRARSRVSGPGRRGSFSVAGRSAVFRRKRYGPALLRKAPRCSCPAVACGDRGVSDSTWAAASCSAPMASRLRCLSTVRPGCLPGHRDFLTRHDSPGFDAGRLLRPLVPRERSRGLARPPPAVSDVHITRHRAHGASGSIRPRRPSAERHGRSVPTRVHLPPQLRHTRVPRKLRFGTWASPSTSYVRRARTGFPPAVWSPSLSGWLPTTPPQGGSHMAATIAPAPKRHQRKIVSTLAATAQKADLAPRHYRNRPTGRQAAEDDFGRFRAPQR